ncbi:MAG TPA: DUF456 domain-containing protein [Firmicutes bacterium]|jgi:uncharacterized protein YqgC (DUF456 family)|nr:DUF456 domain-containing protein [Bacillota bacterium]
MDWDLLLLIFAGLALLIGFLGSFLPVLPGLPLAWAGLLIARFSSRSGITTTTLILSLLVTIGVSLLDGVAPVWFTKRAGGTKAGSRGATVGMLIGLFLGPLGIIFGPSIGAFVGELIHEYGNPQKAFRAAVATLMGFLFSSGIKIITSAMFIWLFIRSLL